MKYLGLLYPGLWNFFWKSFINLWPTLLYMFPNLWNFFGRSSLEGVLKQGLLLLRVFMLDLLNRKKMQEYIYSRFQPDSLHQLSKMIGSTFNIQKFLDYLAGETTANIKSTWCPADVTQKVCTSYTYNLTFLK